mgnify:FL=1
MSSRPYSMAERLQRVLDNGNLTVADLARWLDKPDPTVRGWVRGINVGLPPLDAAWVEAEVKRLETLIRKKRGLPVPRMSARKRIAYMNDLRSTL